MPEDEGPGPNQEERDTETKRQRKGGAKGERKEGKEERKKREKEGYRISILNSKICFHVSEYLKFIKYHLKRWLDKLNLINKFKPKAQICTYITRKIRICFSVFISF